MQSQGLNEVGSKTASKPQSAQAAPETPARKSTLKPPRTNTFKNRDQLRSAAASTMAAETATVAGQGSSSASEPELLADQQPSVQHSVQQDTTAPDPVPAVEAAVPEETQAASESLVAPDVEDKHSDEDLVVSEAPDFTAEDDNVPEIQQDNVEPDTAFNEDDSLDESMNDENWEDDWMDDVSPAREVNRTTAATTQSDESVLSERVSEQEAEQGAEELEESDDEYAEEGFDLDRAEPMFADNADEDDWERGDDADEESDSEWAEEDEASPADELDDEFDDEDWNPEAFVEAPDEGDETSAEDESEDSAEESPQVAAAEEAASEEEQASEEGVADGIHWQAESHDDDDVLFSEAAADDLDNSEWDDYEADDEEDDRQPLEDWDDEEEDNNVFLSDVSEPGAVTEEAPIKREARDLDDELDALLEEQEVGSEDTEEWEAEEMTEAGSETGSKASDSLEYSASEDVDNEEPFEDRDDEASFDEDHDPLFDYSEEDERDEFDGEYVANDEFENDEPYQDDEVDAPLAEQEPFSRVVDDEADYEGDEAYQAEVDQVEVDQAEVDEEVVEDADVTYQDDEEDSVPDFDDELEADAEPEPSDDDAFAAVDPEDDLDVLFDDEDRLRRQAAMEEIEEKESRGRNWMSWASGAIKRFGSRAAEVKAEKAAEQAAQTEADTVESMADDREVARQQEQQAQQPPYHEQDVYDQDVYDQDVMQEDAAAAQQWQQHEPLETAATEDQATVWGDEEQQPGFAYPEEGSGDSAHDSAQQQAAQQQQAGSYQEQQLSLDIEMDADSNKMAGAEQNDGYGRQRPAAAGRSASPYQQQSAFDDGFGQSYEDSAYQDNGYDEQSEDDGNEPSEVLAINVLARQGRRFAGDELLQVLLSSGLRFGEMSIFHRHANGKNGPVLFSVANALNPGTFDLNEISEFTTPGVCFFMTLPNVASNNMLVYEQMLATARHVQQSLDAELKDDNRSVMTAQTMEHYRQRIRDFELQQLKNAHGRR
jgi:cell division protein ZipA